jgi:hypothetical protein
MTSVGIQRKSVHLALWSAILGFSMVLVACGSNAPVTSPYTSAQLIQKGSTNFNNDTALHFKVTQQNIATGLYAVTQADGDVVRPDKMQIKGVVEPTAGFTTGIGLVFVNGQQYVDLGGTGKYALVTGLPDLLAIFSPTQGIGSILSQLQAPSTPTADTVSGVACWKIAGTVTSTLLAPITGSAPTTPTNVQATIWIGQSDYQIHQVVLAGKATDTDVAATTRTFVISGYNETITISVPPTK